MLYFGTETYVVTNTHHFLYEMQIELRPLSSSKHQQFNKY